MTKETNYKYRQRSQQMVDDIKMAQGCTNPGCMWSGEFSPKMLHFHHIDPSTKKFKVASMAQQGRGIPTILEEIAKCQVLCGNCHMAEHS